MNWLTSIFDRNRIGDAQEFGSVYVQGQPLACVICGHGEFCCRDVQLRTPVAFFNVDSTNRIANCAICARCGYVHWFVPPREPQVRSSKPGLPHSTHPTPGGR